MFFGVFQSPAIIILIDTPMIPLDQSEALWVGSCSLLTSVDFDNFLAFWNSKMPRFVLDIFCPRPGISHFFKDPWFL